MLVWNLTSSAPGEETGRKLKWLGVSAFIGLLFFFPFMFSLFPDFCESITCVAENFPCLPFFFSSVSDLFPIYFLPGIREWCVEWLCLGALLCCPARNHVDEVKYWKSLEGIYVYSSSFIWSFDTHFVDLLVHCQLTYSRYTHVRERKKMEWSFFVLPWLRRLFATCGRIVNILQEDLVNACLCHWFLALTLRTA